jgi:putative ABC transport system substrate-binding protein
MRRRTFLGLVAGATAWSFAPRVRSAERTPRIGVLLIFARDDPEAAVRTRAFGQALRDLGWNEGGNIQVEYRFAAGDFDRMRALARELVGLPVDVIVTNSIQAILAVEQDSRTVPIVFAMIPDPVGAGLIKSLQHPGENLTGFTTFESTIIGKWLELLKAIAPGIPRVGFMYNPDAYDQLLSPPHLVFWSKWLHELEAVAPSFAVEPVALPVRDLGEMRDALSVLGRMPSGLLVNVDPFTVGHCRPLVAQALQHRVPGCYAYNYFASEGGLMSYGPNGARMFVQAASYVDRILKGAKAGDLPIQQPNALELVINLKSAKTMGLTVPPWLLARADEVIE